MMIITHNYYGVLQNVVCAFYISANPPCAYVYSILIVKYRSEVLHIRLDATKSPGHDNINASTLCCRPHKTSHTNFLSSHTFTYFPTYFPTPLEGPQNLPNPKEGRLPSCRKL